MDELRECPFCGNKNIIIEQSTFSYGHEYDTIWLIECKNCPCQMSILAHGCYTDGRRCYTKEEAIQCWNNRRIYD